MRIQPKTLALTSRGTRNAMIYWSKRSNHRSSSAKLFADAEKEESEYESRSKPSQADIIIIQQTQENWDGEERIQDTVLRMLIDKYQPLRTGQIRTADEKLKENIPQILIKTNTQPSTENDSNSGHFHGTPYMESTSPNPTPAPTSDRLSPAEPTPPWLVTFKVPSHAQASIKLGHFVSTPPRLVTGSDLLQKSVSSDPSSARTRAKQKAERRFALGAGRIDRARESIIDYQSGVHGQETRSRPNPVSIRGWNALIEERIQKAQATGMFDKIEGRGKPLKQTVEEMNPFVAREEFLMNRIVRKNDAAPPWVELQKGRLKGPYYSCGSC
ncbi:unnamed protein product [Rhizoctonia solani]|uniref:DnaJ homologue subfamily C member 28 conserved domain-containing protein n=1 Tax=Rhizoctonia solani TaxID=456999 RepID=A0A8H3E7A4_9AGAM|nr:unnamed protein product [Rhizoctonia solani]